MDRGSMFYTFFSFFISLNSPARHPYVRYARVALLLKTVFRELTIKERRFMHFSILTFHSQTCLHLGPCVVGMGTVAPRIWRQSTTGLFMVVGLLPASLNKLSICHDPGTPWEIRRKQFYITDFS